MKNSLVIVFFTLSLVHIWGWNYTPNVELKFATLSSDPTMEYSVLPIKNIDIYDQIVISLKAVQRELSQDWIWFIYIANKSIANKRNCDYLIVPTEEIPSRWHSFYNISPLQHEGHLLEIFKLLFANVDIDIFLDFFGCKNTHNNNKMKKKQLMFIVYKYGDSTTLKIWNTSYTFYKNIYGFLQFTNEDKNEISTELNEDPMNFSMIFCQQLKITDNSTYYSEEEETVYKLNATKKHPQKASGLFIVVLTTIAVFIIFLLLISKYCFFCNSLTEA